ncbi:unnamed protein product [Withania somnifera]
MPFGLVSAWNKSIKKMDLPAFKEAEGEREFCMEVDILSRLDHSNLVSLIRYSADGKHRFLVYEYLHKGNLQDHLYGIAEVKMNWPVRLKVAIGAARGLAYLHSSSAVGIPIIHRDFKSTNILLNTNYDAKISDFDLAKLMPEGQQSCVTSRVLGTFGYFDPEYTLTRKLTLQSDVYAFGVVRHILNDKKKLRKVIDPETSRSSYTMESITMFANLAPRCVRPDSSGRPTMVECIKELHLILHTNTKGLSLTMHTFRLI